jgi:hypothetical protein
LSPFATITLLNNDDTLGPPTKKLAVIEKEPILNDSYATTTGPRNINPSPSPRTNENAWSLVDQLKLTYWGLTASKSRTTIPMYSNSTKKPIP